MLWPVSHSVVAHSCTGGHLAERQVVPESNPCDTQACAFWCGLNPSGRGTVFQFTSRHYMNQ